MDPVHDPPRKIGSICPPLFVHAFIPHFGNAHETGKSKLRPAGPRPPRFAGGPGPTAVDAVMSSRHRAARLAFALFVITTGVNLQAPLYAAMARQDGVGLTATTVA